MQKFIALSMALVLAGCATTGKTPKSEPTRSERIAMQTSYENKYFDKAYQDDITANGTTISIIGRNKKALNKTDSYAETQLMVIQRGQTAKAAGLKVLQLATTFVAGMPMVSTFDKEDLRGVILEPTHDNKTLEYARPLMHDWAKNQASDFAPSDKPINKIIIEPKRFYLVYENLVGKEAYRLTNEMDIVLHNSELTTEAYRHACVKNSDVKTLADWKANHYVAVDQALNAHVQSCVADLATNKDKVRTQLTKNQQP